MNLPPTYGRAYYRERVSARAPLVIPERLRGIELIPGIITQQCDLDTRWNRYVFEARDIGKVLVVEKSSTKFLLKINGYLRGEVDSFLGQPFPGTNITVVTFPTNMRICAVREGIDQPLKLSAQNDTTCAINWLNPAIQLSTSTNVQVLAANEAVFVPVVGANTSFILKSRTVPCSNVSDAGGNTFIRQGTNFYRFDPRIRLFTNLLNDPSPSTTNGQCPIVPRTYLSANTCVRRPGCKYLPGTEEACGSPGEVIDRPELGWHYMAFISDTAGEFATYLDWPTQSQRDFMFVVNNLHLKSVDQLRQRIAWSLANIVIIGFADLEASNYPEAWLSFYDIFVRHSFGNYFDLLKEVTYHPLMANYLTYFQNKAYAVNKNYPDENYSREIM